MKQSYKTAQPLGKNTLLKRVLLKTAHAAMACALFAFQGCIHPTGYHRTNNSLTQNVSIKPKQQVIIKCNCQTRTLHTHGTQTIVLHISGSYKTKVATPEKDLRSISPQAGDQTGSGLATTYAENANTHRLRFSVKEVDEYLVLESQESAYNDGVYSIDAIDIVAPAGISLHLLPASKTRKNQLPD